MRRHLILSPCASLTMPPTTTMCVAKSCNLIPDSNHTARDGKTCGNMNVATQRLRVIKSDQATRMGSRSRQTLQKPAFRHATLLTRWRAGSRALQAEPDI